MSSERDLNKPMDVNPAANNANQILKESSIKSQIEVKSENIKNNHLVL